MTCVNHSDREGISICVDCGKVLCEECRMRWLGKNYCEECGEKIDYKETMPEKRLKDSYMQNKVPKYATKEEIPEKSNKNKKKGMPRPKPKRTLSDDTVKKFEDFNNDMTHTIYVFTVSFIVTLLIIAIISYIVYIIYLAPEYGTIGNTIQELLVDPYKVFESIF